MTQKIETKERALYTTLVLRVFAVPDHILESGAIQRVRTKQITSIRGGYAPGRARFARENIERSRARPSCFGLQQTYVQSRLDVH
jgi:hypothetical protein